MSMRIGDPHAHAHVYTHAYTLVCTHICTHVYAHVCTHVYAHVYTQEPRPRALVGPQNYFIRRMGWIERAPRCESVAS